MSEFNHKPLKGRSIWHAMGRGFVGKCPNCGKDRMFSGFLTLKKCAVCAEDLDQYEPSLLLPLAVGLVVVTIVAHVYFALEIMGLGSPILSISVIVPISIVVCLLIIRPFKGALVGAMWSMKTKRDWQE